jgi:PAS domain-containing protein
MLDAMQAMVDTMVNFVGAGTIDERWGTDFGGSGSGRRLQENESDLTLLYRNMPGAAPRSSLSRTQLLDGIWQGRQGDILMIRDGNARLFGYNRAVHESAEISLTANRLELKSLSSGLARTYDYAYRDDRLALRDAAGNILLYRRQNRFSWNRWLKTP